LAHCGSLAELGADPKQPAHRMVYRAADRRRAAADNLPFAARREMIPVTPRIMIDEDAIEEVFVRSGGPGGQNVNKVATAVQLRFDAAGSPSLDAPMQARLRRLAGRRMTADGAVVILARRFRTQE